MCCPLRVASSVSQPLFCRAGQLPARPQAAPTRAAANTAKTQSQQRSPSPLAPQPHHSKAEEARAPWGVLGPCARAPTASRESRSRTACSRENCALCAAEICTVISSAAREVRCAGLKLRPYRFDFYCSRRTWLTDSMAPKLRMVATNISTWLT